MSRSGTPVKVIHSRGRTGSIFQTYTSRDKLEPKHEQKINEKNPHAYEFLSSDGGLHFSCFSLQKLIHQVFKVQLQCSGQKQLHVESSLAQFNSELGKLTVI